MRSGDAEQGLDILDIELQVFGIIMDVLKKEESGEKRTAISLEEAVPKINKEEE